MVFHSSGILVYFRFGFKHDTLMSGWFDRLIIIIIIIVVEAIVESFIQYWIKILLRKKISSITTTTTTTARTFWILTQLSWKNIFTHTIVSDTEQKCQSNPSNTQTHNWLSINGLNCICKLNYFIRFEMTMTYWFKMAGNCWLVSSLYVDHHHHHHG